MNKYMKMAITEAKKGIIRGDGGPFGALIVKDGIVIGKGHNQVIKNQDPTCHGEVMAIKKACKKIKSFDLTGATIYTTGQPCPMCLGAILWANISKVYYGCNIFDTEEIGFRDNKFYSMTEKEKGEFMKELDRDKCLELYSIYKTLDNKKEY